MTIRIMIADDHPLVRGGLKQMIDEQTDMAVAYEATNGDEVLEKLRHELPDVLLMDMSMPGCSGISLIQSIKNRWPELSVLVLSGHDDDMYVVRTIKAGAKGYLTKSSPSEQVLAAIRRVASGRLFINEDLAEKLAMQMLDGSDNKQQHDILSNREQQVLQMLASGSSVSEIANELHLSVKTISTHKTNIMQKMDFANLSELIRYALKHGLAGPPSSESIE